LLGEENALGLGLDTDVAGIDDVDAKLQRRVIALAMEGNLSRACSSFSAAELAEPTEENAVKLLQLHPQNDPPQSPPPRAGMPTFKVIEGKEVTQLLRAFPPASAAGLSGMTPGHLLQFATHTAANLAPAIARVVHLVANGEVPTAARPFVYGARLFALVKKDGGLRPIACGDVYRRLAGKWLARCVKTEIPADALPYQVGVGFPNGQDVAVQSVRQFVRGAVTPEGQRLRLCALTLDIRNAFNSLDRAALLGVASVVLPDLINYAEAAYSQPSRLAFGTWGLNSSTGTQQGDPLSPLLFSATIAHACKTDEVRVKLEALTAMPMYLDDITLCGPYDAVIDAFNALTGALANIGLEVNTAKTKLYAATADVLPADAPVSREPFAKLVTLGVPCCLDEHLPAHIEPAIKKWKVLLDCIAGLDHRHVALALLNYCASGSKVMHLMRGLGSIPQWKECGTMLASTLKTICGGSLSATGLDRATTLQNYGGLGIRQIEPHATIALATSVRRAIERHGAICAANIDFAEPMRHYALAHIAADTLLATFTKPRDMLCDFLRKDKATIAPREIQRLASRAVEQVRFQNRLAAIPRADIRRRAQLECATARYSALWLYGAVFRTASRLWLDNGPFITAVRLRLGEPLTSDPRPCRLCKGKAISDVFGDHTLSCTGAGAKTVAHHGIVDEVFTLSTKAFAQPRREDHPFEEAPHRNMRLDVVIRMPNDRADVLLCDVALIHPVGASHIKHARGPAKAATFYEEAKRKKHGNALNTL
jgi:hypothetical protein